MKFSIEIVGALYIKFVDTWFDVDLPRLTRRYLSR